MGCIHHGGPGRVGDCPRRSVRCGLDYRGIGGWRSVDTSVYLSGQGSHRLLAICSRTGALWKTRQLNAFR
ncbi:hypothetical protein I553_6527 [Mycobacterium xenopi 4042]|uniref:Uncharacterized protein n=1 Tax=Mycobacterium xenopi 4042 TaxID=1299334 RepID=X8BEV8_MYCXE|nr:hypothetical protein I553_6527 [Mycobacterium xenopi 4042]